MSRIAKFSPAWALRAGAILLGLLMLLSFTLLPGASPVHAQHGSLRSVQPWGAQVRHGDPNATVSKVFVTFFTHNDNKDHDTAVSVYLQNRVTMVLTEDVAQLENFAGDDEFGDNPPSTRTFELVMKNSNLTLSQMLAPIFRIVSAPNGNDRWIFDVTFTIVASDGTPYSFTTPGIILDQDNRTYIGTFGNR